MRCIGMLLLASSWFGTLVLACSAPERQPQPPAPPPPTSCAHVADHLLSLLTDTAKQAPAEDVDRIRIQFKTRCEADGWSAEARTCFLELTAKADVNRCAALLTEAQTKALEQPVVAPDAGLQVPVDAQPQP